MTIICQGQGPHTFILHLHRIHTMFIHKTQLHKRETSEVSSWNQYASSCEYDNEQLGSIQGGELTILTK